MLCISVVSLEPQSGRILYEKSSAVTGLSLAPDEERVFLSIERHAPFPLHVSVKMLFFTPTPEDLKWYVEQDAEEEEESENPISDVDETVESGDVLGESNADETHLGDRPSSSSSVRKNLTLAFDDGDDDASIGDSSTPSISRSRIRDLRKI